jgi:shikimate dehydrogenase
MNRYGLIGFPLTHSFSKKYFTEKFDQLCISASNCYELFEIEDYSLLPDLIAKYPDLKGLNVTIPHKQSVQQFLHEIDPAAQRIGAVNVIKISDGKLTGYNSDHYGFKRSLKEVMKSSGKKPKKALILGNGGAAKAVKVALEDIGIAYLTVSRSPSGKSINYQEAAELVNSHKLIINTTPLGTFPKTDACPDLPYENLTADHILYDLVYNPAETLFMKHGAQKKATVLNGYRMLVLQAERSWEIWNS